jgi:hypothetical protein
MPGVEVKVRVLIDNEVLMVASAREGLIVVLKASDGKNATTALPWADVLSVEPGTQGAVMWYDCCKNCGDTLYEDEQGLTHAWAVAQDFAGTACLGTSWSKFHGGLVPGPGLIAFAERVRND